MCKRKVLRIYACTVYADCLRVCARYANLLLFCSRVISCLVFFICCVCAYRCCLHVCVCAMFLWFLFCFVCCMSLHASPLNFLLCVCRYFCVHALLHMRVSFTCYLLQLADVYSRTGQGGVLVTHYDDSRMIVEC
jgi:hypothetical protein